MGIIADFKDDAHRITGAYIRAERIWGSPREGWSCWVGVYHHENAATTALPLFSVSAPYVEGEDAFTSLYRVIEKLPQINPEVQRVELPEEVKPEETNTIFAPSPQVEAILIETEKVVDTPKKPRKSNKTTK